jgi:hypothetical protein
MGVAESMFTKRRFVASAVAALLMSGAWVSAAGPAAHADTVATGGFESGYTAGTVDGQHGWKSTGSAGNGCAVYDHAITNNSGAPASFGAHSLRISDAVTSGCLSDGTYSPLTVNEAGESDAYNSNPNGVRQPTFHAQFSLASVLPSTFQPGMHVSVAPDQGTGARMSYLRFEDSPTGINVFFDDYVDIAPLGDNTHQSDGCQNDGNGDGVTADGFRETEIATNLSRGAHQIGIRMDFVPGAHNDVVKVSIDNAVVATGTSWEDYYRFCTESQPPALVSRTVSDLGFLTRGTADPGNAGNGFLIDNVNATTGTDCTTTCYVSPTGDDIATGSAGDPMRTIQAAIEKVSSGGTVSLAAGTYVENVVVDKAVHITGAGATSIVEPAASNPNCGGGGGGSICPSGPSAVLLVQSSNVTIDHLTVEGDNPSLTSGITAGGADLDARDGIETNTDAVYNNLSVHDTTVKDIYLRGIYASSGGTFNFTNNTVQNVQADPSSIAMFNYGGSGIMTGNHVTAANDALSSNWSSGVQFTNNVVTNSGSGVHTDNSFGSGGSGNDVISGNNISACHNDIPNGYGYGIFSFVPYHGVTISNNTVSGCDVGLGAYGSCSLSGTNNCPGGVIPTTTFTGNTVTGTATGHAMEVSTDTFGYGPGYVKASADHNHLNGAQFGVFVKETGTNATPATSTVTLLRNDLSGNTGSDVDNTGATSVTATCNWWGASSGPSGHTAGSMTTSPWLATSNLTDPNNCYGGAAPPVISIPATITIPEGNSSSVLNVTATLNHASLNTVTVNYHTLSQTAVAGSDFTAAAGTLTFAPGQTSQQIPITINGDTQVEPNQHFAVQLTNPSNATLGTPTMRTIKTIVTLLNDDLPPMHAPAVTVTEGQPANVTFKISQVYYQPIIIHLALHDGTAIAPGDYGPLPTTTITIPAGAKSASVSIPTNLDGVVEQGETFTVTGTSIEPTVVTAKVTIPQNNT